jgi:hypothetical protein
LLNAIERGLPRTRVAHSDVPGMEQLVADSMGDDSKIRGRGSMKDGDVKRDWWTSELREPRFHASTLLP